MDIPLSFLTAKYSTDQGDSLNLHRVVVTAQFLTDVGPLPRRCIIDTGAPLSVVPYDIWHVRKLKWSVVSKSLSGSTGAAALMWQGVPCDLGELQVDLAGPRVFVAKFARQPTSPFDIILGLNFLVDNGLVLKLKPVASGFDGVLSY